ncbi:MAG: substrate-binding domain-containing protein [Clostridiales bacterium]|nr:substrate-binding domain-containing protein [Clostridiales bacterium]
MSYTVEAPAPEPVRSDSDLITVGIVNSDPNESGYRSLNDLDMKLMFNVENGYDAAFFYSIQNSDQITGAEDFISEGVDYLLICPTDTAGWDSVLEDAQAAGVRVIFFDRMADVDESLYETYVHPDPEQEGEQAVAWLESQNLLSYDIVHLQGVMGSDAQTGRTYPLDVMVAAYGNWNYVTQQTAEWDSETAYQIVQSVIDSGESFNVIYAENDDMAQGAVQALDEANISHGIGGEVIIVSFDCHTWALEELLAGEWNYDQQCNPFQASCIDSAIRDLEAGIEPPKDIVVDEMGFDAMTITQDDIDTYGTW